MSEPRFHPQLNPAEPRPQFSPLVRLAWPTILTFGILALRLLADVWFAGRLGASDLAAVAPVQIFLMLILSFGNGSLFLVNSHVSQCIGAHQSSEAGSFAWQGIWISMAFGSASLALWFLAPPFFAIFGHDESVFIRETAFFQAASPSILFQMLSFAITNFFFGIARPKVPMAITVVALVVHVTVAWGLTSGNFGLPALGIAALGWALVASSAAHAVLLLAWMLFDPSLKQYGVHRLKIRVDYLGSIIKNGLPIGFRDLLDNVVWSLVVMWLIGSFGPIPMAAASVLLAINDILMLPCDGMGSALLTRIGRCLGDQDTDGAERWRRLGMRAVLSYSIFFGSLVYFFREPLFHHLAGSPEVASLCIDLAIFAPILLILYAGYGIYDHALGAAGDNWIPTVANLASTTIILGGGGWLLVHRFSETESVGVWVLLSVNLAVTWFALRWRWRNGNWQKRQIFKALSKI